MSGVRHGATWLVLAGVVSVAPADAQQYLVVIGGIGGEARYQAAFSSQATRLVRVATERYAFPESHVMLLTEAPDRDGAQARSTKDNIDLVLADLARRVEADAQVFVVFIGHGSGVGGEARLNIPGPDATASDVASWLARFPSQQVVVAALASASGGFLAPLSHPNRVVVTATRSVYERNEVLFAEHFVRALTEDGADADKDDRISMLEAFHYARAEVERAYERENRLLTEHALLDDNGDGVASNDPSAPNADGRLAARVALGLAPGRGPAAVTDSVLAGLYARRERLRRELDELRALRANLDTEAYEAGLERILLELARTGRAIREREAGGG
ncbi:MAG TPA: hypothetical protein VGA22_10065 [Gemmatimonadales bacterium]